MPSELATLCEREPEEELLVVKDVIEQTIGIPFLEAAIPYGFYDRQVL